MRPYDRAFVDDAARALRAIAPDTAPRWGRMTPAQMFAHFEVAVRYSLGMEPASPVEGGWFAAHVAAPLILGGWIKIPRNQRGPAMYDRAAPESTPEAVSGLLGQFLARLDDADFDPPPHPYFGGIGPRGWARLHQAHLDHHLRQFGAAPPGFLRG